MSHLLYAAGQEPSLQLKPSIFDIIAHEGLSELFHTSFEHLFQWLTSNRLIKILRKFENCSDELYLSIHSLVDFYYLSTQNGLFSEHFYGMKRSALLHSVPKKVISILFSIVLPYLKTKLDKFYEELERTFDADAKCEKKLSKNWLKKIFVKAYPYFQLVWSASFWLYRLLFVANFTDYSSPLLHMARQKLVNDFDENDDEMGTGFGIAARLKALVKRFFTSFLFLIQFLDWYENVSDDEEFMDEQLSKNSLNIRQLGLGDDTSARVASIPASPASFVSDGLKIGAAGICPLCKAKRSNECALAVSGLVFCYTCIFKFIKQNGCCPVTNVKCSVSDLIRIYSS